MLLGRLITRRCTCQAGFLLWTGWDEGYTDASWISNTEDSSSTSGLVFLLKGGVISWAFKKQTCITSSRIESEFVALAAAGKEAEWLRNLILEIPLWSKPIVHIFIRCDSAPTLTKDYSQIYNGNSRHLAGHLVKGLAKDLVLKSAKGMRLKSNIAIKVTDDVKLVNSSVNVTLQLKAHVESETASTNPEWEQLDDLIKMWILSFLCDSLQEQVVTTPGNAKKLWDHLKDLFHDNKDDRVINLDNELRSIKIEKMTVNEYCTKIRSMANMLKNLRGDVSDKNLVLYRVNDLDSRFATLVGIIRHRETFPSFATTRNMLLLKESSFNESTDASTTFESSLRIPLFLWPPISSDTKGYTILIQIQ
ncbi:hybrid signal transduction histidine kinase M [Tanacetum coccineum]